MVHTPDVSSVVSADGTSIAYERSGAGPALILIDPAGRYREIGSMRSLAQLLAADFTVITYDRRGRGDSGDTPPYAVAREVEDLGAIIAAAGGSASLYGVSSGALLALHAAASGLPVTALGLFEPPIGDAEEPAGESEFTAELAAIIATGRYGDAVEHFHRSIGVPDELVDGMRETPLWPALEAIAPSLVYDCVISDEISFRLVRSITVPTLVLDSEGSTGDLTGWAAAVVEALPAGTHRSLVGEWHGVPDKDFAPVLTDFLFAASARA